MTFWAEMRNILPRALILVCIIALIFIQPLTVFGTSVYNDVTNKVTCTNQTIQYETTDQNDATIYPSQSYTTAGANGQASVCKDYHGKQVSNEMTTNPTVAYHHIGTKVVEPVTTPYVAPVYSGGSTCNDGTHSNSTGRGTCSWHGGVAY